jgi:hypothetical protein
MFSDEDSQRFWPSKWHGYYVIPRDLLRLLYAKHMVSAPIDSAFPGGTFLVANSRRRNGFVNHQSRTRMLRRVDSPSIELDHLCYQPEATQACCAVSRDGFLQIARNSISTVGCRLPCHRLSTCWWLITSFCIPSTFEKLSRSSFSGCRSLSTVTFEADSRLVCIEDRAFACCPKLSSLCIPLLWKPWALTASANVNLFRQSHSNLLLRYCVLVSLAFSIAHPFSRSGFPRPSRSFAGIAFRAVALFRRNPILSYRLLGSLSSRTVRHFAQFPFRGRCATSITAHSQMRTCKQCRLRKEMNISRHGPFPHEFCRDSYREEFWEYVGSKDPERRPDCGV